MKNKDILKTSVVATESVLSLLSPLLFPGEKKKHITQTDFQVACSVILKLILHPFTWILSSQLCRASTPSSPNTRFQMTRNSALFVKKHWCAGIAQAGPPSSQTDIRTRSGSCVNWGEINIVNFTKRVAQKGHHPTWALQDQYRASVLHLILQLTNLIPTTLLNLYHATSISFCTRTNNLIRHQSF